MGWDRISNATDFVMIRPGDRFVVPDTSSGSLSVLLNASLLMFSHVLVESCPEYLSGSSYVGQFIASEVRAGCDDMTLALLSVFESLKGYPTCFDAGHFSCIWTDDSEQKVWDCLDKRRDSLSLHALNAGILGRVQVFELSIFPARKRTRHSYSTKSRLMMSAN